MMMVTRVQDVFVVIIKNNYIDPYKPEGKVMLKIEKLSEFAREDGNSRRLSEPVYIRGLPWKILAIPRELGRRPQTGLSQKCLGYFLQCNAENNGILDIE